MDFKSLAVSSLILGGCSKYSSSNSSSDQGLAGITLSGKVVGQGGEAVANAQVYAGNSQTALGSTSASGDFTVVVSAEHKQTLLQQQPNLKDFSVYVQTSGGTQTLGGVSAPISINAAGEQNLGTITVSNSSTVAGTVWSQAGAAEATPIAGVTIKAGPSIAYTDASGKFTLIGVPAGSLRISASLGGFATQSVGVSTQTGQTKFLDQPIVLYPENSVAGDIVPLSRAEIAGSYDSRLPYLHSFHVYNSSNSSKVRYSHIEAELQNDLIPWQPVKDVMQYNFSRCWISNIICSIC